MQLMQGNRPASLCTGEAAALIPDHSWVLEGCHCNMTPGFWLISGLSSLYGLLHSIPQSSINRGKLGEQPSLYLNPSEECCQCWFQRSFWNCPHLGQWAEQQCFLPGVVPPLSESWGLGAHTCLGKTVCQIPLWRFSAPAAHQSSQRSRSKNKNASLLLLSPIALNLSKFTNMYWVTVIITIMNVFVSNVVPDTSLLHPWPKQKNKHLFESWRRNWLWKFSYPEIVSTVFYEWKGFQGCFWLSFIFTSLPDARTQFPSKLSFHHQFTF